ncbi:MAG: hypothetical protein Ct9H90mP4_10340 [Gammaproteobacteria bacterium]|nr:MAG: hypothetical protein Ct9H90mP4_10340 [Gammaproteobacteria bacterium]
MKEVGVRDVVINISYMKERFHEQYLNWKRLGMNIELSYEEDLLGTGGGLEK